MIWEIFQANFCRDDLKNCGSNVSHSSKWGILFKQKNSQLIDLNAMNVEWMSKHKSKGKMNYERVK